MPWSTISHKFQKLHPLGLFRVAQAATAIFRLKVVGCTVAFGMAEKNPRALCHNEAFSQEPGENAEQLVELVDGIKGKTEICFCGVL